MTTYNQCRLRRKNAEQVSYIPTKFAVVGSFLKLKDEKGNWTNGWEVLSVGEATPENLVPDSHDAIKAHRKRTGDAMAKKDFAKP